MIAAAWHRTAMESAMFTEIENLLSEAELQRLDQIVAEARFVDGRASNPHNIAKNNLQIEHGSDLHKESSQILGQALVRNEEVRNFAFFKRLAPPRFNGRGRPLSDRRRR